MGKIINVAGSSGDDYGESAAMKEGRKAAKEGKPIEDNPYDVLTAIHKHNEWNAGWEFQSFNDATEFPRK